MINKAFISNKNKISQAVATPDFIEKGARFSNVLVGQRPILPFVFLVSGGKNKHIIEYAKFVPSFKNNV